MELIDWRALYAANRAAIEGRTVPVNPDVIEGHAVPARPTAPALTMPRPALPPGPGAFGPAARLPDLAVSLPGLRLPGQSDGAGIARSPAHTVEHHDGRRARPVRVHVPDGLDPAAPAALVVALHGCTQTAATFAAGALLDEEADRHGFVVAYPEQVREDNPQGCWNWFTAEHQARGGGEPAFIAGATRAVMAGASQWTIDPQRVFVVGMSAGGAMASVLAATHPDVFSAVAVHSGLAYGCARTLPSAMQAMRQGGPDPEAQGRAAFAAMGAAARVVPAVVVHGTADQVVCPVNGEHAVRQWLATNRLAGGDGADAARPDAIVRDDGAGRLPLTRHTWTDGAGRALVEHVEIEGLGHAWSGGAAGGSYTDPRGPSASAAIWDFFARVSA